MNYRNAYLGMFNDLSKLIKTMESLDYEREWIDLVLCLKSIQGKAEEVCIAEKPPQELRQL